MSGLAQIPPAPSVRPLQALLIKPAGPDCNLACRYCFYLQKAALFPDSKRHRISNPVLEATIRQALESGSPMVNFGWQGGEPTLMGLDFFRCAVQLQQSLSFPGQQVANGLQTNGLLLDENWAAFLRDHRFLVGLSLDGPAHIHNHYRRTAGDADCYPRVIRAARRLRTAGVQTNALTVIHDYSVRFPEEIYDFHRSEGLRWMQFIPCLEPDPAAPGRPAAFSAPPRAYGEFLCRVFDRWIADFRDGWPRTSVRWFDSLFHTYVGQPAPECTLLPECGIYVVVEHNGDVYSCDFYVESRWRLGNVLEGDLLDMLNSTRQREFGRIKAALPRECADCPWLDHCRGGCPKDRQFTPSAGGTNYFCESYRLFFEHADARLRRLAADWRRRQAASPVGGATTTSPARPRRKRVHRR